MDKLHNWVSRWIGQISKDKWQLREPDDILTLVANKKQWHNSEPAEVAFS